MRSRPISERRRLKRTALKKRASLIVKHGRQAQTVILYGTGLLSILGLALSRKRSA